MTVTPAIKVMILSERLCDIMQSLYEFEPLKITGTFCLHMFVVDGSKCRSLNRSTLMHTQQIL